MKPTEEIFLTVFTPTYNRAQYLDRGYNSLLNQTYKNFEWIIIDDGSTDNTHEVVDGFIGEQKLDIKYYFQENGGKHSAFNRVLPLAKGTFLLVLDSDDAYKDNGLEILLNYWNNIPEDSKDNFIGVTGLCENQHGKLIGDAFPTSPFDSTSLEKYYKYNIKGDKSGMMKTEVLRKFRFPEKKGSFYPEAFIWFQVAMKYKTRYINEIILKVYIEAKDSLTNPTAMSKNTADVISDYYLFLINTFLGYARYRPMEFVKYFIFQAAYASYCGRHFTEIISPIKSPVSKAIGTVLFPVSMYYKKKKLNLN